MAEVTADAEQTVRAHAETWNERDYSRIPEVVSDSYVEYNPTAPGGEIRGPDGLEAWMRRITSAFPDFEAAVLDVLAGDETAMATLRFSMTHEGEFNGIPPTERDVEFQAMGKFVLEDGKIEELENYFDTRDLFEQLGVAGEQPADRESPTATARTAAENERLAREHFDRVWHRGELDADVLTDDYRVHTNLGGHETHTLEEYRAFVDGVRAAVPDLRKEPDDVFATDERVTVRYTMTGTQEGEFEGIPATGEAVEINAIDVFRVDDGRIAEEWIVADYLRALKQLGVVDSPET